MAKKKILLLGDDIRLHSGVGTMSKEIVMGTLHKYDWVQLGGAIKHPEEGKGFIDLSKNEDTIKESGISDGYIKVLPVSGYGDPDILRDVINIEKPDAIMHFTDPRFWGWLYEMAHEIRQNIPIAYYNIWDDLPFPHWNEPFYESCDLLMGISKQTYNINKHVCQRSPRIEGTDLHYVQHGIDDNKYFPLDETNPDLIGTRTSLVGDMDVEYIAFFNSRNIRRKGCSDLIQAFGQFWNKLSEEEKPKVLLLMHTDVVDEHGTDLQAVASMLYPEMKIIFSTAKLPYEKLNVLYNIADVTCNPSSAEGFGLSHMESIMSGTPTIATVTGGLQDQMGFLVDGEELDIKHFSEEIPSNSRGGISKECGGWTYPLWPNQSLQGSPMTPYIYDSRPIIDDIEKGIRYWYDVGEDQRKVEGLKGREWAIKNGFNRKGMCDKVMQSFESLFSTWKPLDSFKLIDMNKNNLKYPSGVL
jgi:glycosyltransferase involved in cell wall biosynthesis